MGPELIVMNTLFKNPSTPGAAALAENLAPGADKTPLIDRLADSTAEIPEAQFMAILDEFPHDETVHTAIIARPYLSESVIVRLVALVSPALLDSLISRHPLPEKYRREVMKRRSGRPEWWTRGLLNFGR
jgi:hypothetical protein